MANLADVGADECLASPVDPAEAERALEHLRVADALDGGVLLGHLDPHPFGHGVVVLQPLLPLGGRGEGKLGKPVEVRDAKNFGFAANAVLTPFKARKPFASGNPSCSSGARHDVRSSGVACRRRARLGGGEGAGR
jgi:hypothetical protein